MSNTNKNNDKSNTSTGTRLKTDPRTGLTVLSGPKFTKEDVAKDFPVDCCRDAIVLRRSVGLGKKDPFDNEDNDESKSGSIDFTDKEQVAREFPRTCCRFARSVRRSVGLNASITAEESDKCCFAD